MTMIARDGCDVALATLFGALALLSFGPLLLLRAVVGGMRGLIGAGRSIPAHSPDPSQPTN